MVEKKKVLGLRSDQWQVVGLVSHGPTECGLTPVTYTKLEKALPWISKTLLLDQKFNQYRRASYVPNKGNP